jgi:hypothetical protein
MMTAGQAAACHPTSMLNSFEPSLRSKEVSQHQLPIAAIASVIAMKRWDYLD